MKLACLLALLLGIALGLWAFGMTVSDKVAQSLPDPPTEVRDVVECSACQGNGGICGKVCGTCRGVGFSHIYRSLESSEIQADTEPDCTVKLHLLK